jgi:Antibiotic biosynthesis monooxygenase
MIVCWRTVHVPESERERFSAWIEENREEREEHGILFELVLERSVRQNPAKTLQPPDPEPGDEGDLMVVTAWSSHDAFDAWINTPDRTRLTNSNVHRSVEYGPITRHDTVAGYLNIDGLSAVAESPKEEP